MTPLDPGTAPTPATGPVPGARPALHADREGLSDEVASEIVHGRLLVSPRPGPKHVFGASVLGALLTPPFGLKIGGPGGWIILSEPELHLGLNPRTDEPHVLIPDLAGWRRERMPTLPETAFFPLVPDWVCEFLSPSTTVTDRTEKLPFYAAQGVTWLWLADPDVRTLETYQLVNGRWTLLATWAGDAKIRPQPFDAVELELGRLWAP